MILLIRFIVSGHSMEPTFKSGQTLLVSSLPFLFREPKVGDVVIVRDQKLLLKRVIRKQGSKFFVTGDNTRHSRIHGPISKEQILGKVIWYNTTL